ncbi:MAG TPA: T9SS type A sorting domain-containing protein [bacterium]|nr:T9SS type A sorting domain-containing protein [bacterium]HPN44330.1 T9SS type A sorting domain-containing protein [bacterium]
MKTKFFDVLLAVLITLVLTIFIKSSYSQWEEPSPGDMQFMPKPPGKGFLHEMLSGEQQAILDSTIAQFEKSGKSHAQIKVVVDSLFADWGIERPEPPHGPLGGGLMEQLSAEQRVELETTIEQLRKTGASRDEIHQAVEALLSKWGVERPEPPQGPLGGGMMEQLSAEQRAEFETTIEQLRKTDTSRDEIHLAVESLFSKWGIERPEPPHGPFGGGLMEQLSERQRAELENTIEQLRKTGTSRDEIHQAVEALLSKWGVERPEPPHGPFGGGLMAQLSEQQRAELENTIKQLRDAGKMREEVRAAVDALLDKWGIERPEPPLRQLSREIMEQLTTEQKQKIHTKVQDLKEKGTSPEEIRQAVNVLLLEFGITPPKTENESNNESDDTSSNSTGVNNTIIAGSVNFPNPFNPHTRISYALAKPENVKIQVFNINGQLVRTLIDSYQSGGNYACMWNGVLENGEPAPSGLYFYRIDAGGEQLVRRMTLTK